MKHLCILARNLRAVRPEAFTPNLAVSLNTLSYVLWGLGRRAEALVAAVEAQALSRRSVSGKMTRGSKGVVARIRDFFNK